MIAYHNVSLVASDFVCRNQVGPLSFDDKPEQVQQVDVFSSYQSFLYFVVLL